MALILNIETATTVCSVSISKDGQLIAFKEQNGDYSHAENLTLFIEEVIKQSGITLKQLDAVAVSKGPGSYTGLRIGVSTAKGLCYALEKPLIAINTLEHLSLSLSLKEGELACAMIDARRMEVYCAIYDQQGKELMPTSAEIIDEHSFAGFLKEHKIIFVGDGAAKCKDVLSKNKNAVFVENIFPSAKNMIPLSEKAFQKKQFENLAYFEPFYLKDFVAGKKEI
jgi:tRNA threonylcarbamoyladenosine biosynthesis protein TsaB